MTLTYITGNSNLLIASIDRSLANFITKEENEGDKSKKNENKNVLLIDGIIGSITYRGEHSTLEIMEKLIKNTNHSLEYKKHQIEEVLKNQDTIKFFLGSEFEGKSILEIIFIETIDRLQWTKLRFVNQNQTISSSLEKIELFPEKIAMWHSYPLGEDIDILNKRMKNLTKKLLENKFNEEKTKKFIKDSYIKSKRFSVGFGVDIYMIRPNNINLFNINFD